MEYITIAIIIFVLWTVYLDKTQEWDDIPKQYDQRIEDFHNRLKESIPSSDKIVADFYDTFMKMKQEYLLSLRWDSKRKKRLRHDDYTCQGCGQSGVPLDVHHWKGYNLIPNEGLGCLVSLCRKCHTREHTIHGYPQGYRGYMKWNHPITKG